MDQLQKEEVVQAVLIADNFNDNFLPITQNTSPVSVYQLKLFPSLYNSFSTEFIATCQYTNN